MDPNAAWHTMHDRNATADERADAADALGEWLRRGGFPPAAAHAATPEHLAHECERIGREQRAASEQADAAYCAAYVEAAHLGASSAVDYIRSMVTEYDQQLRNAADGCPIAVRTPADAIDVAAARAKRDAYADALRVLDIAADAATRAGNAAAADLRGAARARGIAR